MDTEKLKGAPKEWGVPVFLVVLSVAIGGILIYAAGERDLSQLELVLFQVLILVTGLIGSFRVGVQSAKAAAEELVKPHAKSAFRRVLGVLQNLSRLAQEIREGKTQAGDENYPAILDVLEARVESQMIAVVYALEDWRDIVPDEVDEAEERARRDSSPVDWISE